MLSVCGRHSKKSLEKGISITKRNVNTAARKHLWHFAIHAGSKSIYTRLSIEAVVYRFHMLVKIGVLLNFANFTGKHLRWSLFNKVAGLKVFFTEHLRWLLLFHHLTSCESFKLSMYFLWSLEFILFSLQEEVGKWRQESSYWIARVFRSK